MFYMFSGPDFLYANAFYPNAKTYVLSALEPVGLGARPHHAARVGRRGALQFARSLSSILSYSFFITQHMKIGAARRPGQRRAADPLRIPGALGQDHP